MPFLSQILVTNLAGTNPGEIVALVDQNHVWSPNESLGTWLAADVNNTFENWGRSFAVLQITDKTIADLRHINGGTHYFDVPVVDSTEWVEMYNTGAIVRDWATIEAFLRVKT